MQPDQGSLVLTVKVMGAPAPWQVWVRRSAPTPGFLRMQAWQEEIRAVVLQQRRGQSRIEGAVTIDTAFYLEWPETAPQRNVEAIASWREKHLMKKPDLDNLRKAAVDAVASVLLAVGDQQVVAGTMSKQFAEPGQEGYTIIVVRL